MFQVFSIIVWIVDNYYYYASVIIVLALIGILLSVYELRSNSQKLHDLATHKTMVDRITNEKSMHILLVLTTIVETVGSDDLVPGDLVVIPENTTFIAPCDMILMAGQCVVNEFMLTGESVPIVKVAIPKSDIVYDSTTHKSHTIFSGTTIMQTRNMGQPVVYGLVTNTGFHTTKGKRTSVYVFLTKVSCSFYHVSQTYFAQFLRQFPIIYSVYARLLSHCHCHCHSTIG